MSRLQQSVLTTAKQEMLLHTEGTASMEKILQNIFTQRMSKNPSHLSHSTELWMFRQLEVDVTHLFKHFGLKLLQRSRYTVPH